MIRCWYDPWYLMVEMIGFAIGAIFVLGMDLASHFFGECGLPTTKNLMYGFKQRMYMAYTTVPFYLEEVKNNRKTVLTSKT